MQHIPKMIQESAFGKNCAQNFQAQPKAILESFSV